MRFTVAGIAFLASAVIAAPSDNGLEFRTVDEVKDQLLPISEMTFTGPVVVGGPNVTLHGDASSIYEQILAINPTFNAEEFQEPEGGLEARQTTNNWNCNQGTYVEAYYSQCANAINRLITLGTNYCSVPASTCARVACSNSCSIYLCNNRFIETSVYCSDIAVDMGIIVSKCGTVANGDTRARGTLSFQSHYTYLTQQTC
ncbi:hypothetical protein CaCOL14_005814 [Colletotrichum acutatum]|uniref:Secreted protein n=1 Tax=Glomerella acutata TaxID=27357 RepID=A0AAD8UP20_GLOAC|nr:uncharacterized protein BDZ83DRAFT_730428 [Colletotrichum acutatum]KAK1725329.1 hypothetical protein BDZ83DRAFT_730428 [Colletotrichum acutatum]